MPKPRAAPRPPDLPVDPEHERASGWTLAEEGDACRDAGDREGALAAWQAALKALGRLADIQDPEIEAVRGSLLSKRASAFLAAGRAATALPECRKAMAVYQELVRIEGGRPRLQLALASLLLGRALEALGRHVSAGTAFDEAVRVARPFVEVSLVEAGPLLAASLASSGEWLAHRGHVSEALERFEEAARLQAVLVERRVPEAEAGLVRALETAGWLQRRLGRVGPALASFSRAAELAGARAATGGDWFRSVVASALTGLGLCLVRVDTGRALGAFERAVALFDEVLKLRDQESSPAGKPPPQAHPVHRPPAWTELLPPRPGFKGLSPALHERLLLALEMAAFLHDQQGRGDRAAAACERLVRERGLERFWQGPGSAGVSRADPTSRRASAPDAERQAADAWWYRSLAAPELPAKLAASARAAELLERLSGPRHPELRERLMMVWLARASYLERSRGPTAAVEAYDRAIRLMLGILGPARGHASESLAEALSERARALVARGDCAKASAAFDSAVQVLEALLAEGRDELRGLLVDALLERAVCLRSLRRQNPAIACADRAIELCRASAAPGEFEPRLARAWRERVEAVRRTTRLPERREALERAIELHESLLARGCRELALPLAHLWSLAGADAQAPGPALTAFGRAVELFRLAGTGSPADRLDLARALVWQAGLLGLSEEPGAAAAAVQELLALCGEGAEAESPTVATVRLAARRLLASPGDSKRRAALLRKVAACPGLSG
jgi:tetratricopeptide (TPR) repeat protein